MDAAAAYGNISTVPLYDTIGKEYLSMIIDQTQLQTIACSKDSLKSIVNLRQQNKVQNLKTLICFDSIEQPQLIEQLQQVGLKVVFFTDIAELDYNEIVEQCNSKNLPITNDVPLTPDSIYTITFTSSSTGAPKGAIISHGNIISNSRTIDLFDANF